VPDAMWAKLTSLARALEVLVSAIVQTAEQEAEIALIVGAARARVCEREAAGAVTLIGRDATRAARSYVAGGNALLPCFAR